VRRRSLVAGILVVVAVLLAGSWFGWGRDGLTPVKPATTGADEINELYLLMGVIAALVLLSVIVPLALILGRYRARGLPRDAEGPQIRGNVPLELTWTAIPIVIVLALSGIALWKAVEITDPESATAAKGTPDLTIKVDARQFYWRYIYPNGVVAIDTLRVPVDQVVKLEVTAPDSDVIHSFWAPAIGGKIDAVPGVVNEMKFLATRTGEFPGTCAELCGIQHAAMKLEVHVLTAGDFRQWLQDTAAEQQSPESTLGATLFTGVCSKCHFAAPEYAPNIAGSPLLADEDGMRAILENGRRRMPAVGKGWTERETTALLAYLKTISGQGASDGG
jgi:cytochrome c oxidase subunit II